MCNYGLVQKPPKRLKYASRADNSWECVYASQLTNCILPVVILIMETTPYKSTKVLTVSSLSWNKSKQNQNYSQFFVQILSNYPSKSSRTVNFNF